MVIEADAVEHGTRVMTYRSLSTGRRWMVIGNCDKRGDCLIGAVLDERAKTLDVPVTPEFEGCCEFSYVELERA